MPKLNFVRADITTQADGPDLVSLQGVTKENFPVTLGNEQPQGEGPNYVEQLDFEEYYLDGELVTPEMAAARKQKNPGHPKK